jgi:hypothetical protein
MKVLTAIALLLCSSAYANPDQRPEPPPRRGPPPQALEACKDKAPGTTVEIKTPRGDIVKGTCRMVMIPDRDAER